MNGLQATYDIITQKRRSVENLCFPIQVSEQNCPVVCYVTLQPNLLELATHSYLGGCPLFCFLFMWHTSIALPPIWLLSEVPLGKHLVVVRYRQPGPDVPTFFPWGFVPPPQVCPPPTRVCPLARKSLLLNVEQRSWAHMKGLWKHFKKMVAMVSLC